MNRRGLLFGFGALLAAPSIVRVSSLMAIKPLPVLQEFTVTASYTADGEVWRAEWERIARDVWPKYHATPGLMVGDTFTIEGILHRAA